MINTILCLFMATQVRGKVDFATNWSNRFGFRGELLSSRSLLAFCRIVTHKNCSKIIRLMRFMKCLLNISLLINKAILQIISFKLKVNLTILNLLIVLERNRKIRMLRLMMISRWMIFKQKGVKSFSKKSSPIFWWKWTKKLCLWFIRFWIEVFKANLIQYMLNYPR